MWNSSFAFCRSKASVSSSALFVATTTFSTLPTFFVEKLVNLLILDILRQVGDDDAVVLDGAHVGVHLLDDLALDTRNKKRARGEHREEHHVEVGHAHHQFVFWLGEKVVIPRSAVRPRPRGIVAVTGRRGRRQPDRRRRVRLVIPQPAPFPLVDQAKVTQRRRLDELHGWIFLFLQPVSPHVDEHGRDAQHREPHEGKGDELHEREVQHDTDAVRV
mmetsp:Transcript_15649/g.42635  ORF Transcript_15649/g.42635 Transcript_15649/m.42635 type:complete len:217 (+) Transcript_15649:2804-3454(+)